MPLSASFSKYQKDRKDLSKKLGNDLVDIMMKERSAQKDSSGHYNIEKNKRDMKKEFADAFEKFFEKDSKLQIDFMKSSLVVIDKATSPAGAVTGTGKLT